MCRIATFPKELSVAEESDHQLAHWAMRRSLRAISSVDAGKLVDRDCTFKASMAYQTGNSLTKM